MKEVDSRTKKGNFGKPRSVRLDLVIAIHELLLADLTAGGSQRTLKSRIGRLRVFYTYADDNDVDLTGENVREVYSDWIDTLYDRVDTEEIGDSTAWAMGITVAQTLAGALEVPLQSIRAATRLRHVAKHSAPPGGRTVRESLERVQGFCGDLLDIVKSLSTTVCRGPFPIRIPFESNGFIYEWWPGFRIQGNSSESSDTRQAAWQMAKCREAASSGWSTYKRSQIVNLRVMAEFQLFIATTAMNVADAIKLRHQKFSYESWQDGYRVRGYKERKRGEVLFEIFSEYRPHFEEYLKFRDEIFPQNSQDGLFAFYPKDGVPDRTSQYHPVKLKKVLKSAGRPYIPPSHLRKVRTNWLLRNSDDPRVVAELNQHGISTMRRSYQWPNHERAGVEWTKFFAVLETSLLLPANPLGRCNVVQAEKIQIFVAVVPEPDCKNPAGCLFCRHYRGVDSQDYIWGLLSFRKLKALEMLLYVREQADSNNPLQATIDRATEIIAAFRARSARNEELAVEAESRLMEEDFHPRWTGFIAIAEALL